MTFCRGIGGDLEKIAEMAAECGLWRSLGMIPVQTIKTRFFRPSLMHLGPIRETMRGTKTAFRSLTESDTYRIVL